MSYPFQRLVVYSCSPGSTDIYWDLDEKFCDPGQYTFQLQINKTPNPEDSDWSDVGSVQTNVFKLTDNVNQDSGYQLDRYYRVILTTDTGIYVSPVEGCFGQLHRSEWKTAQEIIRQEILRNKFVSVPGVYLKRKTTGPSCPHCTDSTGASTDSSCPYCYGTGYYGGYYNPVDYQMMEINPAQEKEIHTSNNVMTFNMSMNSYKGRALGIPELHTDDIWVDLSTSQRFKIAASQVIAQVRRVPLVRAVEMVLLPASHIAYSIPIGSDIYRPVKAITKEGCGIKCVNHDYPTTDALQYVDPEGKGIAGGSITIYTGTTAEPSNLVFRTGLDVNGRWEKSFMADLTDYCLVFEKTGYCGPDTVTIHINESELTEEELAVKTRQDVVTDNTTPYRQLFW